MKGIYRTGQWKQHGFMLMTACVLSFMAVLFAVEFSFPDADMSRTHSKVLGNRQAETSPGTPVRQQSTLTPQPMRAILIEAIVAKAKASHLIGGNVGLATTSGSYILLIGKPAQMQSRLQLIKTEQRSFRSARAPPVSA
ncbi:hypothetical protein AAIB41_05655 [Brucella sp. BE17]|uniref:hypothetical protein n=1 Tax=Brucella sp. BE17 TaxID=3142977 RepID=UPI0031BABE81